MKLTAKQRLFVSAFVQSRNATQAAIAAGYSEKTAYSIGQRLLKNVEIAAAIEEQIKAQEAVTLITANRVLQEYARLAFFDLRQLFGADGRPKSITDLDDDTAAAIAGLDVVSIGNQDRASGQILKYKIADKKGALDSLAKYLGLLNDRVTLGVGDEIKELLTVIAAAGTDVLTRIKRPS